MQNKPVLNQCAASLKEADQEVLGTPDGQYVARAAAFFDGWVKRRHTEDTQCRSPFMHEKG